MERPGKKTLRDDDLNEVSVSLRPTKMPTTLELTLGLTQTF